MVSWQYAPLNTSMSAEAISGILLGNRLTQDILPPLAFLHRPEAGEGEPDALHYAITQALDWVPVGVEKPEHLWLSGVDAETEAHAALMKGISTTGLKNVDPQMGFHNSMIFWVILVTHHSGLPWQVPHNQYNNNRHITY